MLPTKILTFHTLSVFFLNWWTVGRDYQSCVSSAGREALGKWFKLRVVVSWIKSRSSNSSVTLQIEYDGFLFMFLRFSHQISCHPMLFFFFFFMSTQTKLFQNLFSQLAHSQSCLWVTTPQEGWCGHSDATLLALVMRRLFPLYWANSKHLH